MMWPGNAFKRSEFACKCGCGFDTVDAELLRVLEDLRVFCTRPVIILSGCRCSTYNNRVKGASKSKHLQGRAADVSCSVISPTAIYEYLDEKYPGIYGIGLYKTFVHIDTRSGKPWRKDNP